ncbi:ectonucleotide pyrophosphatase/phosphodiesterase [Stenotrophomonas sp. HITSZ_GD]|uniref:alkaline phosphatase family protein n=1 Tax=Stenotrophomonas sp. HITSZ_GD TaxID=3037248 RepID=UPI00240DE681|nr:ectonucleotide pyrophosphatase/phosphodiesterase [Stenotrophomonas sp. HITSZ_GD]MDG2526984.1 ectonucleotide pyrophosphatase/phosphodiesterase [Stenotrophomonas sp. HITSZ_GD]
MTRLAFVPTALLALLLAACSTAPAPPAPANAGRPQLLLISIDGLRADALDWGITPHLSQLAAQGVRAQWMNPSYPALTFPNHYTLVTGLRPDHHGIVHNSMDDADLGGFKVSQADAVGDSRWWGGEPIWVGAEKAGLHAATWSWPGSEAAIDGVRPTHWIRYDAHVSPEQRARQVGDWLEDRRVPLSLVTLYFDQVDKAGHDHGPQSPEYRRAIVDVDRAIGGLVARLRRDHRLDQVDIVVVSDHGMATVPPRQVLAVEDMVPMEEAKVVSIGQSVGIAPRPGQEQAAERRLLGAHAQYDCWRRGELPARWHYGTHPRVPPIICQMHEGWDALPADEVAARHAGHVRGSHGYDPALPSMRAVFIARGPRFATGKTLPPFDNVDVYPLLAGLLGIPAAPNDGDAGTLRPALRAPVATP